jgi:choline dehydrogenase-like flavoprotein
MKEGIVMTTRRVEVERFSLISSKPFEAVLTALKAAVGHPDMAEFPKATRSGAPPADAFTITPALVQPTSRGAVRLASKNFQDAAVIDGNYLGTARSVGHRHGPKHRSSDHIDISGTRHTGDCDRPQIAARDRKEDRPRGNRA